MSVAIRIAVLSGLAAASVALRAFSQHKTSVNLGIKAAQEANWRNLRASVERNIATGLREKHDHTGLSQEVKSLRAAQLRTNLREAYDARNELSMQQVMKSAEHFACHGI